MNLFNIFIYLIITVKVIFFYYLMRYIYYKYEHKKHPYNINYSTKLKNAQIIKNKLAPVLTILMSILLIILFYPHKTTTTLDSETKELLCFFGIILIFKEIGILYF